MSNTPEEEFRPPKYLENSAPVLLGMAAVAALYYQLPRWATGLDPMFVHPSWVEQSPFPFLYDLAAVHPLIWIAALTLVFVRIFRNFGWTISRRAT